VPSHNGVTDQIFQPSNERELVVCVQVESAQLPHGLADRPSIAFDHVSVVKDSDKARVKREDVGDDTELVGIPNIILIAKGQDLARCETHSSFEVADQAEARGVVLETHREWSVAGEAVQDLQRAIHRCIVANYELIRTQGLSSEAIEELLDVALSVPSAQAD
jgi:hypothetical protein